MNQEDRAKKKLAFGLAAGEEGKLFIVENYLEAVGMMTPAYDLLGQAAVKSGVSAGAVMGQAGWKYGYTFSIRS